MPYHLPFHIQSIRSYYEQNTHLFLSLDSSPHVYSIHRSIWMKGVETRDVDLSISQQVVTDATMQARTRALCEAIRLEDGVGAAEEIIRAQL